MNKPKKCPGCKKYRDNHIDARCEYRFFNGDWFIRDFASIGGGSAVGLPTQGEGNFLGGQSSGYKPGDTPALNTAIARHGKQAVRRAINLSRRGR